ncbi:Protein of unknown function [Gryllus bimaculatus]|nr:Protein of unknown function [Gryllus bimaculatus]
MAGAYARFTSVCENRPRTRVPASVATAAAAAASGRLCSSSMQWKLQFFNGISYLNNENVA